MIQKIKEHRFHKIISAHDGLLTSSADLTGSAYPSSLCLLMGMKYRKLFDSADEKELRKQIAWRRRVHPLVKRILPSFITQDQVIENREALRQGIRTDKPDVGITLPDEPVIWMGNHGFKDDVAATLNAIYRHAYILFGSVPQFYNTLDGVASDINGVIMVNRKVKASTSTSSERAINLMRQGVDLVIFPEGVWNKTPNLLLLPFWSGIYRIAKETGTQIVPVVHYVRDPLAVCRIPDNVIHTVIDDPVSVEGMSENAALQYLRDIMATWRYLLIERYGDSTRKELIDGADSCRVWEQFLGKLVDTADYYDEEIELTADYRPREIVRPEDAFRAITEIKERNITWENAGIVAEARKIVEERERADFQRRF